VTKPLEVPEALGVLERVEEAVAALAVQVVD